MTTDDKSQRLIWIDCEMTGLSPEKDQLLEIAAVITDGQLNILAQSPEFAIRHSLETLDAMDDWNRNTHTKSGLWQRVLDSHMNAAKAEAHMVAFLAEWVDCNQSPMCGNSICQDRRFLARLMPRLESYFHYRNIDVSTIKELCRRWNAPLLDGFTKQGTHTALSDIIESVNELKYYRQFMGSLAGAAGNP
jgi:oligoribonuclease